MPITCVAGKFNLAAHLAGPSGPPPFTCPSQCNTFTVPGFPEGPIINTYSADFRRIALMSAGDNLVTFIDTSTASVITQTACTNQQSSFGLVNRGAFAISSGEFYIPTFDGAKVFSADGATVTTVAMPGDLQGGNLIDLIYSPDNDLIYGMATSTGDSEKHVFSIDPATHVATDLGSVGLSGGAMRLGITNNQLIVAEPSFRLSAFSLSGLTLNNQLSLNTHGMVEYAPSIDRIFVGENTFGATNTQIDQIDPATLTVEKTYTAATSTGLANWLAYNSVNNTMDIGADGVLIIDLEAQTLACEQILELGASGMGVDSSGGALFTITDLGDVDPTPMGVFAICS